MRCCCSRETTDMVVQSVHQQRVWTALFRPAHCVSTLIAIYSCGNGARCCVGSCRFIVEFFGAIWRQLGDLQKAIESGRTFDNRVVRLGKWWCNASTACDIQQPCLAVFEDDAIFSRNAIVQISCLLKVAEENRGLHQRCSTVADGRDEAHALQ